MDTGDEFSIEVISKSLNDIQGEKGRNERLLQTESARRMNSEYELQTIIQKRKNAEKKYIDSVKELATLKSKCTALDRQHGEVMREHNSYREEIDRMTSEERRIEEEHKHTMSVHYKLLDEIVVKFRNTKIVMMNEVEDGDYSEIERELSLLEEEFGKQANAMDLVKSNNSVYDSNLKEHTMEECLLKEYFANLQILNSYFKGEMEKAEKQLED